MTGAQITVIGWSGQPLSPRARAALDGATLVVGGRRLLDVVCTPPDVPVLEVAPLAPALEALAAHDGPAVVLAGGDPGLFGITRTLRALGHEPAVLPAVSSVAHLAALAGQPWDDAVVMSAHGRSPRAAVNAARALPAVFVLTAPDYGPAQLARDLTGWQRTLMIGERLGHPDQHVTCCEPAVAAARSWREPNVVLVIDEARRDLRRRQLESNQPAAAPPGFGLPEGQFRHRESMITKWEVRAVALARLGATLGTLIWDVGAGSGSVAIECARLGAAVIAIEADPDAVSQVSENAVAHGVDVRVVPGIAPAALSGLPDPDAAFVGGGGLEVLRAVADRSPVRLVATFAAIDRVAPAREILIAAGYQVEGLQLQSSRLSELPDGGVRLVAQNPVVVLAASRPEPS